MTSSRWNNALHSALISILLLWLTACGGSSGSLMHNSHNLDIATWPTHSWDQGAQTGSYTVVAVDSLEEQVVPLTDHLGLTSKATGGSEVVSISAHELEPTDHAYLHLKYDASQYHPVSWHLAPGLEDIAIFLGITSKPGVVVLGIQTIHALPLLANDIALCEIEFAEGAFTGTRFTSVVSDTPVSDLRFNIENREQLEWTYTCPGDYNQDSRVLVSDITPIGQYYEANEESPNWQVAQVADGNDDKLVYINDLTRIGQNFQEAVVLYKIQGGPSETGPFSGEATVDARLEEWIPEGGGFKRITYTVPAPVEGAWYVVWAIDGEEVASEHSNAAQYSVEVQLKPPTGLIAYRDGDNIFLNWNDPAGVIPDGYSAYAGNSSALLDAVPLNTLLIKEKPFLVPDVVSVDSGHYFGVKAVYGTQESEYSNIYHYQPSISGDVPQGLTAVRDGDHIRLDWLEPINGTPDHYTAYAANNPTMEDAIHVTGQQILTTTWDVSTTFSPDQEYYFAVTATFSSNESNYSNIAHYEPSSDDTDPPTWDIAGSGIKSATPGNGTVTVSWFIASDPSPPITYIVYYAEDGSFDWASATTEEVLAPATATVISGLTNDITYEFGVRARDNFGNTDTNTNTLKATPSGSIVPIDTGVWLSSVLVDDGGVVPDQDVGWLSDIEVHPTPGTIGIAHHNHSGQDLLFTEGSPGSWTTVTVASEGDTGLWPDLEFHPTTGEPCIAYHNAANASLEYATRDGSSWDIETVDSFGDVGAFASLEFHPTTGYPCIAYFDALSLSVRYAEYNGTSWALEIAYTGAPGGMDITGSYCSLDFNPVNNEPGIAFMKTYDFSGLPQTACWITQHTAAGWNPEVASLGPYSDLGIDTSGFANSLCYSDSGVAYIITVELMGEVLIADKSGGIWVDTSVATTTIQGDHVYTDIEWHDGAFYWVVYVYGSGAEFGQSYGSEGMIETANRGGSPSIDVMSGTAHASYLDIATNQLRYAVRNSSTGAWSPETADAGVGGEGVVGERASLAYHPTSGYPLISYYDASNSALKYADKPSDTWRTQIVANDRNDGSASQMGVRTADGAAYIAYFSIGSTEAGLIVAKGGFGLWNFTTVTWANFIDGGDVAGNYCSLGMNSPPLEVPGVAYHNTTQRRMEFALGSPIDSYEITTIDEFNDPGRWSSVAFNPANKRPAVAYYVRDTMDLYFVERAGNGDWSPIAVDTTQSVGNRCSMCYSSTAEPWISYYDESNSRLRVAYIAEGEDWAVDDWQYIDIAVPGGSTDYGTYSSIAWHPLHDRAAIAFYDADAGKLWYVFIGDAAAPQAAVEVAGSTANEGTYPNLVFNTNTNQPGIAYHDVEKGDLRYMVRTAE